MVSLVHYRSMDGWSARHCWSPDGWSRSSLLVSGRLTSLVHGRSLDGWSRSSSTHLDLCHGVMDRLSSCSLPPTPTLIYVMGDELGIDPRLTLFWIDRDFSVGAIRGHRRASQLTTTILGLVQLTTHDDNPRSLDGFCLGFYCGRRAWGSRDGALQSTGLDLNSPVLPKFTGSYRTSLHPAG